MHLTAFLRKFLVMLPACVPMAAIVLLPFAHANETTGERRTASKSLDFGHELTSSDARILAGWIIGTSDNQGLPFIIVDKSQAKIIVLESEGRIRGASPVLLGLAKGDTSVPGIGTRPIPDIRPDERTTPAGRFVAEWGRNSAGEEIIWVDYEAAISMHRVRSNNSAEHRLRRLATPTTRDNRISYGCINVPLAFFDKVIKVALAGPKAVIYVLPEMTSLNNVFHFAER